MPLHILLFIPLFALVLAFVVPVGIVQRYRAGKARRVARFWLASVNAGILSFSVFLFLVGAAITSFWAPNSLAYSLAGLAGGCLLGILGLALTRWERAAGTLRLHYTPNRFLVLVITLIVTARLAYGVWRLWQGWGTSGDQRTWLLEPGVPGALAAGAIVLGYSLAYWIGVSRRARRHG